MPRFVGVVVLLTALLLFLRKMCDRVSNYLRAYC